MNVLGDWLSYQTDPFAVGVSFLSLLVSAYIAVLLHNLSRRFQRNEAVRAINLNWDSFHNAMLAKETHDLFWQFVRSSEPVTELGQREHHIVLMYLNNIHTEYHTYRARIFRDFDRAYLDVLLRVFVHRREAVLALARLSGYDKKFLNFIDRRLKYLAQRN